MKKMQRKKRLFYVLTVFLLYVFPSFAQQLDNAPVVSIDANIGVLFLSPMKGTAGDITGWQSLNTDNTSGMHTKYRVKYYLHRGALSVGVKVSFPFSFTATDTQNIFTLISDLLFPEK